MTRARIAAVSTLLAIASAILGLAAVGPASASETGQPVAEHETPIVTPLPARQGDPGWG